MHLKEVSGDLILSTTAINLRAALMNQHHTAATAFSEYLRRLRIARCSGLRQFAQMAGLDPSFYGRIERGDVQPPAGELLERIAHALKLEPHGCAEWFRLADLSALGRGRIPQDLLNRIDVDDVMTFFARMRSTDAACVYWSGHTKKQHATWIEQDLWTDFMRGPSDLPPNESTGNSEAATSPPAYRKRKSLGD